MTYHGKFQPRNIKKYQGDATKVIYRSLWERNVMRWLDANKSVEWWNSEELVVPYRCKTDNRVHRYFLDFAVKFKEGPIYVIEVKPSAQTKRPVRKKGKAQSKFIKEATTYTKNMSKWYAARAYCEERGYVFEIWTQDTLESLGIKVLSPARKAKACKTKRKAKLPA